MKPHDLSPRHHQVLSCLSLLPRKIVALHGADHLSEFILHDLCHNSCFNLEKAAYFVDNPDFDCFQGIAGYDQSEHTGIDQVATPEAFSDHLRSCLFNQRVRKIGKISYKRARRSEREILKTLAPELFIKNPSCYIWQLKYDNYGVLIYENGQGRAEDNIKEHIENGLHFLGFCSIS